MNIVVLGIELSEWIDYDGSFSNRHSPLGKIKNGYGQVIISNSYHGWSASFYGKLKKLNEFFDYRLPGTENINDVKNHVDNFMLKIESLKILW